MLLTLDAPVKTGAATTILELAAVANASQGAPDCPQKVSFGFKIGAGLSNKL